MKVRTSIFCACLAVSGVSWAAEEDEFKSDVAYADVRLGIGVPLGAMKGSSQAPGFAKSSEQVRWSRATEVSLRWLPWPSTASEGGSGVMALGISSSSYALNSDAGRDAIEQRQLLGVVELGIGWAPAPRWTIDGAWHLGLGRAWQPGSGSDGGTAVSAGVAIDALVQVRAGLLIGLRLSTEWRSWQSSAYLDGVNYDLAFQGMQYVPAAVIGWRF